MKTLCKIKPKHYDILLSDIKKVVLSPKFLCKKCLRAASDDKVLCKAEKL